MGRAGTRGASNQQFASLRFVASRLGARRPGVRIPPGRRLADHRLGQTDGSGHKRQRVALAVIVLKLVAPETAACRSTQQPVIVLAECRVHARAGAVRGSRQAAGNALRLCSARAKPLSGRGSGQSSRPRRSSAPSRVPSGHNPRPDRPLHRNNAGT